MSNFERVADVESGEVYYLNYARALRLRSQALAIAAQSRASDSSASLRKHHPAARTALAV